MLKLLIVDDEPMICEGLKAHAQGMFPGGWLWIRTAASGEEALRCIGDEEPDMLITDIRMPGMSGIDLLSQIRGKGAAVKAVVLSGYSDFEYVRAAAVLGIENYLLKPVGERELLETLESAREKIRLEKKLKQRELAGERIIQENIVSRWLGGSIGEKELYERADFLPLDLDAACFLPCCIGTKNLADRACRLAALELCAAIFDDAEDCAYARTYNGDMICVFAGEEEQRLKEESAEILNFIMERIRQDCKENVQVLSGECARDCLEVPERYRQALHSGAWTAYARTDGPGYRVPEHASPVTIKLADYVRAHYREELSLKTLSVQLRGNAAYLGQLFRKDMGVSFSEYLKKVRIDRAKELLTGTQRTAGDIGEMVGFPSKTYFTTVFKQETGKTPERFRKDAREGSEL